MSLFGNSGESRVPKRPFKKTSPCSHCVVFNRSFEHARDDALAAKSALIISNMRLVVSIANRYRYACALAYDDMIQEGAFGLAKAAVKFDPAKGCRFSTYATIWIKQAVFRASADQSRVLTSHTARPRLLIIH